LEFDRQPPKIRHAQFLSPRRGRNAQRFQHLFGPIKYRLQLLPQHFAALAEAGGGHPF
jgi:hypothetical protein